MKRSLKFSRLAICLAITLVVCCKPKAPEIQTAGYLVTEKLTDSRDSVLVSRIADTLLSGTAWRGNVFINRPYQPSGVNIYLIDGDKPLVRDNEYASTLIGNCSYAGRHILFLDEAYLSSFLPKHHVLTYPSSAGLIADSLCFLYWVIGHELGHLVCGHLHGHFDKGSLDSFVATSSLQNREELQADSFLVHALVPHYSLRISLERMVMDILNAEIEQEVGKIQTVGVGIIYDYTGKQIVTYARQPTHPEYVIRLSRMLELSTRVNGDSGMYHLVSGFIQQLKEVPAK